LKLSLADLPLENVVFKLPVWRGLPPEVASQANLIAAGYKTSSDDLFKLA
jgi:hypothetical protein